jgi:sugar phosphate isomerase/epimerase
MTALAGTVTTACTKSEKKSNAKNTACLKISLQESVTPGNTLRQKLDFMESLGIAGIEPSGHRLRERLPELKAAVKDRTVKVSAICAGFSGFILSPYPEERQLFFESTQEIIQAASELEALGVVIVPAFNGQQPQYPHTPETRKFLIEQLQEIGQIAALYGTSVILEPLNRGEAFFLRQVADAASICRDANNNGVRCMGDFWHMTFEETSDMGAFLSAGDYLQHVHIASRKNRLIPGEDGEVDDYVNGFTGLKMLGYDKYISYECGCSGDRPTLIAQSVKMLEEQWAKA